MRFTLLSARLARRLKLSLLCSFALLPVANAQFTNYFTNQVFSTNNSTATSGSFNGNNFTINHGTGTVSYLTPRTPGNLPAGHGFPTAGREMFLFNNKTTTTYVSTITFTNPITADDHIYVCDIDYNEAVTLRFKNAAGAYVDPSGFIAQKVSSSGFPGAFSITKNATSIAINSNNVSNTPDLLCEVIPNTDVKIIELSYGATASAGGFGMFFGRNRPVITQNLSDATIEQGQTATLTYTISGINNNPQRELGFTNTLPAGWVVAPIPAVVNNTGGTVSAIAGSKTVSLSGVNNNFTTGTPVTSRTFSVSITNEAGFLNADCGSLIANSTNGMTNFTMNETKLQNEVSPQCLIVTIPLPVTLISISAKPAACDVLLSWQTGMESNSKEYVIERSADGKGWLTIGSVAAAGFSHTGKNYNFKDRPAAAGNYYYRLRMVDISGEEALSPVVHAKTACTLEQGVSVYPNPIQHSVQIEFSTTDAHQLRIFNAAGQLVYKAMEQRGNVQLSVQNWPAGIYQMLIQDETGNTISQQRLIKQ